MRLLRVFLAGPGAVAASTHLARFRAARVLRGRVTAEGLVAEKVAQTHGVAVEAVAQMLLVGPGLLVAAVILGLAATGAMAKLGLMESLMLAVAVEVATQMALREVAAEELGAAVAAQLRVLLCAGASYDQRVAQLILEGVAVEGLTTEGRTTAAPALSSSATPVLRWLQAAQLLPLVGTPTTRSLLLGHSQHEPLCPN
jgi:hypothetical protein